MALWCPRTLTDRWRYAKEAVELAQRIGDERGLVVAATLAAVAHGELGDLEAMQELAGLARTFTTRLRLPYGLIVLEGLELPWLAMAGRFEEADTRLTTLQDLVARTSVPNTRDAALGALVSVRVWQGRTEEIVPALAAGVEGPLPLTPTILALAVRTGDRRWARDFAAAHPVTIDSDDWMSMLNWGCAAEAAAGLGDRDLAARAYAYLAPYAGRVCCAGSTSHMGPVDAFLALAAAATGELGLARDHAEAAERLMETWRIPLAAKWFHDQRDRLGF